MTLTIAIPWDNKIEKTFIKHFRLVKGSRMEKKHDPFNEETSTDELQAVLAGINSQYEDVTITKVTGNCPYGHTVGEKHT